MLDIKFDIGRHRGSRTTDRPKDKGIALLAALPNVYCKLSGIAMTVHTFDTPAARPWYGNALEQLTVARRLFGISGVGGPGEGGATWP